MAILGGMTQIGIPIGLRALFKKFGNPRYSFFGYEGVKRQKMDMWGYDTS